LSALGVHILVSLFFVIGTMLEFAVVLSIKRISQRRIDNNHALIRSPSKDYHGKKSNIANNRPLFFNKTSVVASNDQQSNASLDASWENRLINRSDAMTDRIDFLSIFLFLFSYFLFNCIYVAYYV